jgi:citrate/tricarballylate utilization protein
MQDDLIQEVRRQAEICNACRYCEGYCAVFPALHAKRAFSDGDITQLANLCHNCRGCYYACQYTAPHEFNLNLPQALANVRQASWEDYAWPQPVARIFHRNGLILVAAMFLGFALLFATIQILPRGDDGFYAYLSHGAMVAIFLPAFLGPLACLVVGLRRYWADVGGGTVTYSDVRGAFTAAATMRNLSGGHGDGCNFEEADQYTQSRRYAHQAVMYGFLLCLLSTTSGTILHYFFDLPAPYDFWSLPKLLGVPGGVLMMLGSGVLAWLKLKADRSLGSTAVWSGEMGFIFALFFVATTGLALYMATGTTAVPVLLAVHLGAVLSFSKMVHGFYRLAALVHEEGRKRLI